MGYLCDVNIIFNPSTRQRLSLPKENSSSPEAKAQTCQAILQLFPEFPEVPEMEVS
jgi:hypothetical protein